MTPLRLKSARTFLPTPKHGSQGVMSLCGHLPLPSGCFVLSSVRGFGNLSGGSGGSLGTGQGDVINVKLF